MAQEKDKIRRGQDKEQDRKKHNQERTEQEGGKDKNRTEQDRTRTTRRGEGRVGRGQKQQWCICCTCAGSALGQLEEPISVQNFHQSAQLTLIVLQSVTGQIDPGLSCTDKVTTDDDPNLSETTVFG